MIERLFEAGVDVFRINMSHSSFDVVRKVHADNPMVEGS
jgi:pyruvate kinase